MYDLIYEFLLFNIFTTSESLGTYTIGGTWTIDGNDWLCHTITIVILILLIVCLCCFVKWLVKTIGGLIA